MKKLNVHYASGAGESQLIGTLAETNRRVYFEYAPEFLATSLWLSPFKLPPEPGLHEHRDFAFGPLFGLFDDSLPDGWGLLLMDRHFRNRGIRVEEISPLDRLAYMGMRTMGALTYHPPEQPEENVQQLLDLHRLAEESYDVLSGKTEDILPQLMRAGGSPGGARPKVLVGIKDDTIIAGADELPDGYAGWLIKFHSRRAAGDEGRVEYAYAKTAGAAGISMPPVRLFSTAAGETFFGIQRFDRAAEKRIHVHTFGNLIHSNFRIPGCDYEQLLKTARILTKNQRDVEAVFRQMIFNILMNNRDDHVKNFSFLLNEKNEWQFAPAYDLTYAPGPGGEHSMTVAGEGRAPAKEHVFKLAERSGIKNRRAAEILDEVAGAANRWNTFAEKARLDREIKQNIRNIIKENLRRFYK